MKSVRTLFLAAAAAALIATPVFAQIKDKPDAVYYYETDGAYDDEVIVIAPEMRSERTASGARIETLVASRSVYTADLDLRYDADVDELRRRVRATAIDACNDLELQNRGVMLTRTTECVRDAQQSASAEIDAMIYAARG